MQPSRPRLVSPTSHVGLNKGEAGNALRPAAFFHRQGEFHDRTFESQGLSG